MREYSLLLIPLFTGFGIKAGAEARSQPGDYIQNETREQGIVREENYEGREEKG